MPTYQYACTACDERLEAVQKFTDDPLTICEACGGQLRKVYSAVGIVFKGSGFYRNDSRNGAVTAGGKDKQGSGSGEGSGEGSGKSEGSGSADSGSSSGDKAGSGSGSGSSGSGSGSGSDSGSDSGSGGGKAAKKAETASSGSSGSKVA